MIVDMPITLFKKIANVDETTKVENAGAKTPVGPTPLQLIEAEKAQELKGIKNTFQITSDSIGASSAFGSVYHGVYAGLPVAVKIEPKEAELSRVNSKELDNLKVLQMLRAKAPKEVRVHLPIVYMADGGKFYNFYVLELLAEAHSDVKDDLAGHSIEDNETLDAGVANQIAQNPFRANDESLRVKIRFGDERWLDKGLFESAWKQWLKNDDEMGFSRESFHDETTQHFLDDAKKHVDSILEQLALAGKTLTLADAADMIAESFAVEPQYKQDWQSLVRGLPELLAVIAAARWIPKFHSVESDKTQIRSNSYGKVGRTKENIESDDYRHELINTLHWLSENGLHWADAHMGNIMMRPSTGDIVFIDFGLYETFK